MNLARTGGRSLAVLALTVSAAAAAAAQQRTGSASTSTPAVAVPVAVPVVQPVDPFFFTGNPFWWGPSVSVGPTVTGPITPGGFVPRPSALARSGGFRINPPPAHSRAVNVRIAIDGPGAATRGAVLGTPADPPGTRAIGWRAVNAALGVAPTRRIVRRATAAPGRSRQPIHTRRGRSRG